MENPRSPTKKQKSKTAIKILTTSQNSSKFPKKSGKNLKKSASCDNRESGLAPNGFKVSNSTLTPIAIVSSSVFSVV